MDCVGFITCINFLLDLSDTGNLAIFHYEMGNFNCKNWLLLGRFISNLVCGFTYIGKGHTLYVILVAVQYQFLNGWGIPSMTKHATSFLVVHYSIYDSFKE